MRASSIEGARKKHATTLRNKGKEAAGRSEAERTRTTLEFGPDSGSQAEAACSDREGEPGGSEGNTQGGSGDGALTSNARKSIRAEAMAGGRAKLRLLKDGRRRPMRPVSIRRVAKGRRQGSVVSVTSSTHGPRRRFTPTS